MTGIQVGTQSVMSVMVGSVAGVVWWATGEHLCFRGRHQCFTARMWEVSFRFRNVKIVSCFSGDFAFVLLYFLAHPVYWYDWSRVGNDTFVELSNFKGGCVVLSERSPCHGV